LSPTRAVSLTIMAAPAVGIGRGDGHDVQGLDQVAGGLGDLLSRSMPAYLHDRSPSSVVSWRWVWRKAAALLRPQPAASASVRVGWPSSRPLSRARPGVAVRWTAMVSTGDRPEPVPQHLEPAVVRPLRPFAGEPVGEDGTEQVQVVGGQFPLSRQAVAVVAVDPHAHAGPGCDKG
jgi:hypothetical protein